MQVPVQCGRGLSALCHAAPDQAQPADRHPPHAQRLRGCWRPARCQETSPLVTALRSEQCSTCLMCAAAVSKMRSSMMTSGPGCCAGLCLTLSDVLGGGAGSPAHHLSFHGPTVRITCANPCALQYALSWEGCLCAWLVVYVLMLESMSKAGTGCFMHRVLQICSMRCASM